MTEIIFYQKVICPILIIIICISIYLIVNKTIKKIIKLNINTKDIKRKRTLFSLVNNLVKYFLIIVAIIVILNIYGINTSAILASLGIVSLIAGLAFQDILKDLLSGISIIIENQYTIGDTVTINGNKGEVISLGIKTTKLRNYEGEIIFIANRNIDQVINHSLDHSLVLIDLGLSYDEDIDKIEKVLNNLFKKIKNPNITREIRLLGIEKLDSSSVVFRIEAEVKPMKQYETKREILKQIKIELDKNNIEIPYEQLVIHNA